MSSTSSKRIPSIDGLRAVSVLIVIISHAVLSIESAETWPEPIQAIAKNGHLGVVMFFVISGYLITTLLRKENAKYGKIDLKKFYIRRSLRIFPAFYVYLLVLVGLAYIGAVEIAKVDFGFAATYTWNYRQPFFEGGFTPGDGVWWLGHVWSLALEEQFYLLWPAIVIALHFTKARRFALAVVLLSPLSRLATYALWPESRGAIGMMLHTAVDPIMLGCYMALSEGEPWFVALKEKLTSGWLIASVAVFLYIVSPQLDHAFGGAYTLPIGASLEAFGMGMILLWAIQRPETAVGRILNHPVVAQVGILSYSLYLWQQFFLMPANETFLGTFPTNIAATLVAASLSYYVVEKGFLKIKERYQVVTAVSQSGPHAP